jgi:hypothetical protein
MKRAFEGRKFARLARLAVVAAACIALDGPPATAQGGGLGDFLSHLFGAPAAAPPTPAAPARRPHKRDFVPATTTRAPGTPGGAPVQANFFIDVLGDSFGVLAAGGLTQAFADKPDVAVADKSRDASGLVRSDYYDWPKTARDLATGKDHIDFVVIMMGVNDLQQMRDGAETLEPLSDRWRELYGRRVEAVVAPFVAAHIPVAWVGLPPMRLDRLNAEVVKLNEIDRERAEKAGAKYVDIWNAFADEDGQYDAYGPDVDGQNVKLREADGVLLTKAGARKLASFLDAEIRRVRDKNKPQNDLAMLPPDIEQEAGDINAQIRREMGAPEGPPAPGAPPPEPPKPEAGPILSLTARPTSPGGTLAEREATPADEPVAVVRVLRLGEPVDPRAGRADDFSWPRL